MSADPISELRACFPVVSRLTYLNAGTNGPIAAQATAAARAQLELEEAGGRGGMPFFRGLMGLTERLRAGYAARLTAAPEDVAVTTCTTDGVSRVLQALALQHGAEILTSDEEHPGVLGPLGAQRARGVRVRVVPFAELAMAVRPQTTIVVCSHVSWRTGAFAPRELAEVESLVLLDGAQGPGAVPVDVGALGADFYSGSGQKWLCGPVGTGMLYVSPRLRDRIAPATPGYLNLVDPSAGLDAVPRADAQAYDTPSIPGPALAHAVAMLELFEQTGWDAIHARAHDLAELAATQLRERGRSVLARDRTTLVTWTEPDAAEVAERLAADGVIVRSLPGEDLLRASFGGWSDERDLERLLGSLPA